MTGRVLLDTNIVIALFAQEVAVQQHLATTTEVFVLSIVLGELYYGARKSARIATNVAQVNIFAANSAVLVCDTATSQYYGEIKNVLRTKGRPIPENDIWIAAIAKQYSLTLVSRDSHFNEIDGLSIEGW